MSFRMGHHAQNLTSRVADSRYILNGATWIPWIASFFSAFVYVFEDDLLIRHNFVQGCFILSDEFPFPVCDGQIYCRYVFFLNKDRFILTYLQVNPSVFKFI